MKKQKRKNKSIKNRVFLINENPAYISIGGYIIDLEKLVDSLNESGDYNASIINSETLNDMKTVDKYDFVAKMKKIKTIKNSKEFYLDILKVLKKHANP